MLRETTKAFSLFNEIQQSLSLLQRNKRFLDPGGVIKNYTVILLKILLTKIIHIG